MRRRDGLGDRERERDKGKGGEVEVKWRSDMGSDVGKWRRGGGIEEW